jgi:hypothetical protein
MTNPATRCGREPQRVARASHALPGDAVGVVREPAAQVAHVRVEAAIGRQQPAPSPAARRTQRWVGHASVLLT